MFLLGRFLSVLFLFVLLKGEVSVHSTSWRGSVCSAISKVLFILPVGEVLFVLLEGEVLFILPVGQVLLIPPVGEVLFFLP